MIVVWQSGTDPDHNEPATRLRASSPAADQLVLGDAVLGEKTLRSVVLDRVGQHPARLLGQVRQRRHPQYAHHVLSGDLHGSPALCLGVFQGLDRTEQAAEADFVALVIGRIGEPLVDWYTGGLRLADLGLGQLGADGEFQPIEEGVIAGRDAHFLSPVPCRWHHYRARARGSLPWKSLVATSHPVASTASRMTRVTTGASEMRDRCPASTSVMRAPARLAMNVSSAGGMTR